MADTSNFSGGSGGSSGKGKGSGQGEIQAKVNALSAGLQSLKVVINDLRQQGFQGGKIFEALSEKISKLLIAEGNLTKELEDQKTKFKNNKEQLALYTKEQAKVQAAVDGTVKVISSLTQEQIDNTKTTTKLEAEKSKAAFDSGKVAEKSQLDVLEQIKLRLAQEGRIIEAIKKSEQQQEQVNKSSAKAGEANSKAKFKAQKDAAKAEETAKKAALKANDALELQKVRSSNLSVAKRLQAELSLLNKTQKRYKKGSAEYAEIERQKVKATADSLKKRSALITKYQKSRPDKKSATSSFTGGLKKGFDAGGIGQAVGRITGIGTVADVFRRILGGVKDALIGSFKAAVNFEAQLAQLQAVTGINNTELVKLEKNILNVAGSTKFTSEEIVELQTELGKLGFSPDDIINATQAIADTAQALGEKVGPVAQKVGQILNQYNLASSETVKVSDILVSTINNSALSFESFGTALQYVGPLAAEVGTSFNETAAAMALLADNGFTASRIGTGLRGIFTELSTTGEDLLTVIKKLESENISLAQAVDLVGKRNAAQLITLIDNVEQLEKAETSYYAVGAAAIASAQQIDTYSGNLDLLKSAFNRVQIQFGEFLKSAKLLRFALILLDKDGYNTAVAMEFLSKVDPSEFSDGMEAAAENALRLSDGVEDAAEKTKIYNAEAEKLFRDSLTGDEKEYYESQLKLLELEKERAALTDKYDIGFGFTKDMPEEVKAAETILKNQEKVLKIRLDTLLKEGSVISERDQNAIKADFAAKIKTQTNQLNFFTVRQKIENDYKSTLEELRDMRNNESLDLVEALKLRTRIVEQSEALKIVQEEANEELLAAQENFAKVDVKGASEEDLAIAQERVDLANVRNEQLDQEQSNLANITMSEKQLFALAQKEYSVEFSTLQNRIRDRRAELKTDQELLNLSIKTSQNEIDRLAIQIENTEDADKKLELQKKQKTLIEEQTDAESKKAVLQKKANEDVEGYSKQLTDDLEDQRELWKNAGFTDKTIRVLEEALLRVGQIQDAASDLKLDFPEALVAADGLVKSLKDRFAEELKNGGVLSEESKAEVAKSLSDLFSDFELTEEQRAALNEYVLSGLKPGSKDKKKAEDELKESLEKMLSEVFGQLADVADEYNQTALENTKGRLDAELEAIKSRYKTEEDILKSQLDNQLVTESQYRAKQKELRKKQLVEENEIKRKVFEAEKKSDATGVVIETAEALASNILENYASTDAATATIYTVLGTAAIAAAGAAKVDAINRRQFFPVQFSEGGIVNGRSHAEGGVPFTVQGRPGYEMEGGEFVVNKKATSMNRGLLEQINSSYKLPKPSVKNKMEGGEFIVNKEATSMNRGLLEKINSSYNIPVSPSKYKFASGGFVSSNVNESVDYLKAIAEATTSTAIGVNKPVRSFITDKDLRTNSTERRIRDRNDRI